MNKNLIWSGVAVTVFMLSGCGNDASRSSAPFESEELVEDMNSSLSNEVMPIPQDGPEAQAGVDEEVSVVPEMVSVASAPAAEPGVYVKPTDQEVQQSLLNAGVYTGKVDGVVGPRTKKAIRDFQAQNDLTADGKIGPRTWAKLEPYLRQAPDQDNTGVPESASDIDN